MPIENTGSDDGKTDAEKSTAGNKNKKRKANAVEPEKVCVHLFLLSSHSHGYIHYGNYDFQKKARKVDEFVIDVSSPPPREV